MAEQATEQIAVEWDGIGHFVATKHPEYVAEDPESGFQTMYPPRISYRLSQQLPANVKELDAPHFAFHLARYAKASEGDAEFFMHQVCKLILERLDVNDSVEIQGLGVFSWVESQQGKRLSLQVDEKMRAQVNAPFACFEPVVVPVEAKPQPSMEAEAKPQPSMEAEAKPQPSTEVEAKPQPAPEPIVEEPAPEPVVEAPAPIEEEPVPVEEEPVPVVEEHVPEPVPAPEPTPAPEPEPAPEVKPEPAPVKKRVREPEPTLADKLKPLLEQLKTIPKYYLYGGGAVILLFVIWLLLPSSKIDPVVETPQEEPKIQRDLEEDSLNIEEEVPETEVASTETEVVSTKTEAKAETKPVQKKAEPKAEPKPVSKSGKPSNDMLLLENGQPKMDQLGDGGRLTLVALRHYGDKAFWAYIYDVNAFQLGNPNNVPIGKPLYLPDPTYFKIDASDPASVKRAQNRAMQILREWE